MHPYIAKLSFYLEEIMNNKSSKVRAPVLLERFADGVAVVTLNRPSRCNAVNPALARTLEKIATEVEDDDAVRAVVLCGAGPQSFCAGADLREVAAGNVALLSTQSGGFAGITRLPKRKIWIAAVHGAVFAGGLEIMLSCDFAFASDTASFALPEVKWGLIASEGGLYRLPRAIPPALAAEMIVTGAPIDAAEAKAAGLVNRIVPESVLKDTAISVARQIAANAPLAVRHSKALLRQTASGLDEDALHQLNREALAELSETEDFNEGPRAFIERRTPIWKGR